MSNRKHPLKNYSPDEKAIFLSMLEPPKKRQRGAATAPENISKLPSAPSRRTLYRWAAKSFNAHVDRPKSKPVGRPKPLSKAEEELVAGKVLSRIKKRRPTNKLFVVNWLKETWHLTRSEKYVERLLKRHNIRLHQTQKKTPKQMREPSLRSLCGCLRRIRAGVQRVRSLHRVVAMDEKTFWNVVAVQRSFGYVGGYVNTH